MALKITEEKGIFIVEGKLNGITALNLKNHIEAVMPNLEDLVIDIENVTQIDGNGMNVLRSIYTDTIALDIKFYVVGTGCKEVYDDLYLSSVA